MTHRWLRALKGTAYGGKCKWGKAKRGKRKGQCLKNKRRKKCR